jgi:hypothetical protein
MKPSSHGPIPVSLNSGVIFHTSHVQLSPMLSDWHIPGKKDDKQKTVTTNTNTIP